MTIPNNHFRSSARHRNPVSFRGIDGHQLAQQYALRRELGNSSQSAELTYPVGRQGGVDTSPPSFEFNDPSSVPPRSNDVGLIRRLAVWLSRVGAQ